jgi:hypothetical protein
VLEILTDASVWQPVLSTASPVTTVTPPPPLTLVVGTGVFAVVLVTLLWPVVGHLVTFAHEGGHALMAVALGSRVRVRLHADRTGVTEYTRPLVQLPVTAAGYVAPSGFGVLGAVAVARGSGAEVLVGSVVLLGLLLLVTRNWFGWFALLTTAAAQGVVVAAGSPDVRVAVACVEVWLLLVGGLVHVARHGTHGVDFATLRVLTWVVPAAVWAVVALATAVLALVYGGLLMVGAVPPPG